MKKTTINMTLFLCSMTGILHAQESTSRDFALEEIFVTAQKKVESLQKAPIAITAFNSEQLEIDGITGVEDLSGKVPSATLEPFPTTKTTLIIYIRGVGIEDVQMTQDPSVAIYLDGVYMARSSGTAMELADLERIEVLKGPQGTLYGRNTTGGAINLITQRPDMESTSFRQKLSFANRDTFVAKSTLNVPLSDNVAVKLAALHAKEGGFVENTGPGGDYGDTGIDAWRFDMRWDVNDKTTVDYAFDKSDIDHYNYQYQAIKRPFSNKGALEVVKQSAMAATVYNNERLDELETGPPLEENSTDMEGHALVVTHSFSESMSMKYIGAYRELQDRAYYEFGGGKGSMEYRLDANYYDGISAKQYLGGSTPLTYNTISQEQLSHELQFSGELGDALEYVVGGYYFEEEGSDLYPFHLLTRLPLDSVPASALVVYQGWDIGIKNEAWAAFFQTTWTPPILDERLDVTIGMRYSEDTRSAIKSLTTRTFVENTLLGLSFEVPSGTGIVALPAEFDNVPASRTFTDDSFSIVLGYELDPDINVYGKVVDSYKSGGFNVRDPQRGKTGDPASDDSNEPAADGRVWGFGYADGFEAESVISYELGMKADFLESRLRINAATYLAEFKDRQMNFVVETTIADSKVMNAGEAEARGLELDTMWLASRDLLLSFNYAYLNTEVTNAKDAFGRDRTEEYEFFSAPLHSYTASVDYTLWSGDAGRLALNVSYNYMAERNGDSRRDINLRDAYDLVNVWLGLTDLSVPGGNLSVALWGKNVLDEEYWVAGATSLPHADQVSLWGDARRYGIDLVYEWKQ